MPYESRARLFRYPLKRFYFVLQRINKLLTPNLLREKDDEIEMEMRSDPEKSALTSSM